MYASSNLFLETMLTTRFSSSVLLYDVLNYIFIEILNLDECFLWLPLPLFRHIDCSRALKVLDSALEQVLIFRKQIDR